VSDPGSDADRRWLNEMWPFVRDHLPPAPGLVVDIGCGPLGGFVPALRADGYDAEGVDPTAPDGAYYHRVEFERYTPERPTAAIVASTSLHHVADLDAVVDLIAARLEPGGVLVVIEWARERFDEATARWCFDRLSDGEPGWLHCHRDDWLASARAWSDYLRGWAETEHLHTGQDILAKLGTRFDTRMVADGPYFFPDLTGVTAADEQAAIDAGQIQANGIRYVGRRIAHS
jgi:SAM-dependent methyltransferase